MMKIKCGSCKNTHSSVAEVRACYEGPIPASAKTAEEPWPWAEQPSPTTRDPFSDTRLWATEPQKQFVALLAEERDLTGLLPGLQNILREFQAGESITKAEASSLIPALKSLPKIKVGDAHSPKVSSARTQKWRELAEQVPDGNYAVDVPGDKLHYYRVSRTDKGFVKIQERASEGLYPKRLVEFAKIFELILEVGVEAAGLRYATELKRCRKCNLLLTDQNNPYLAQGYGPDCGSR